MKKKSLIIIDFFIVLSFGALVSLAVSAIQINMKHKKALTSKTNPYLKQRGRMIASLPNPKIDLQEPPPSSMPTNLYNQSSTQFKNKVLIKDERVANKTASIENKFKENEFNYEKELKKFAIEQRLSDVTIKDILQSKYNLAEKIQANNILREIQGHEAIIKLNQEAEERYQQELVTILGQDLSIQFNQWDQKIEKGDSF